MCSLLELQRALQASVVSHAPRPQALPGDASGTTGRLGIYTHAYRARLVEALKANYPVLHRVTGDEGFETLARAFISASPSTHRSIRWFGGELAAFLKGQPSLLPHPALLDLVKMEWAIGRAFDAPDRVPVSSEEMARVPPQEWHALRFALHPSVRLLELQWTIEPVWQAVKADEGAETLEPRFEAHALVVWRQHLEACWRSLDSQEANLLGLLTDGRTFGGLCRHLTLSADEHQAAKLSARLLHRWVGHQLLIHRPSR